MRIKFCNNKKIEKVKSEKGFTLLELIMVTVVTGILSSTLILPFISSMKRGTQPEIYATATYLAVAQMEWARSNGYTETKDNFFGTTNPFIPDIKLRTYTAEVVAEYVTHAALTFNFSAVPTEFIRVTATIGNSDIPNDVVLWTILIKGNYDPNANS